MKYCKNLRYFAIFAAVLLMLVFSACQSVEKSTDPPSNAGVGKQVEVEGGMYMDVTPTELQQIVKSEDSALLVNVHIPFEGNLPGTDQSIPYDQIGENLDQLPADKDAKIIIYCRSGFMSGVAAKELVKLGYTNVWNLAGGMAAWQQAGLPIEE